jgi:hypothetical protein
MNVFKENGGYSWRKLLTAIAAVVFAAANLGYLITHNFDELPGSYQAIIASVFVFYFAKETMRNIKITK